MQLKHGTVLQGGRYRIEKMLGQGGFGITYLAFQPGLERYVAIKEFFMKEHCNRDADTSHVSVPSVGSRELVTKFKEKFIKEAQMIAGYEHPNIVTIYDNFEENGTAYYVMKYYGDPCGNSTANSLSALPLPLACNEAAVYIRQVASALSYLHERNTMHLDVKPSNVLIDREGNAVLIDFGVSKRYDKAGHQTSSTPVGLSHGYAPGEQYQQSTLGFSPTTDIYALGATYYKLVTGDTPPDQNEVTENGLPPFPATVPASIASLIKKSMQPRRKDRPQSIAEFLGLLDDALAAAAAGDEIKVDSDDDDNTVIFGNNKVDVDSGDKTPTPSEKKKSRRWVWWALVALIIVGVAVFAVMPSNTGMELCKEAAVEFAEDREDLSNSGRANCYIVSENGSYKFPTVKGNSSESVGAVKSVEVLWESFGTSTSPEVGDLIKSVSYSDGYITFQTADAFKEGNAVIAARNASGTILWSWHIWLTDQPGKCVYANNAGTMMDRNLGATSATPGEVGALGLLYQWGRKDPFLGSSSISSSVAVKSTISWPSAVSSSSSRGTISYATEHPTTFITYNTNNDDWYYTGDSSTDNTRWQSTKTIYDPCPAGWRVPDGGSNGVWKKAGFDDQSYDSSDEGMLFGSGISSPATWYPAAGHRESNDGALDSVGYSGHCWSVTPSGNNAYYLLFRSDGYVHPTFSHSRAGGRSVRCLQE